jgi:acyl-CoA reductase-like NAD-dependent aldehyde dehydrogenase
LHSFARFLIRVYRTVLSPITVAVTKANANSEAFPAFGKATTIPSWLDGEQVISNSTFDVVSPLDQSTIYQCPSARNEDVLKAVASAQRAIFEHEAAVQACTDVAGLIQITTTASMPMIDAVGGSSAIFHEPFGVVLGMTP